jgi:hypothetical protein
MLAAFLPEALGAAGTTAATAAGATALTAGELAAMEAMGAIPSGLAEAMPAGWAAAETGVGSSLAAKMGKDMLLGSMNQGGSPVAPPIANRPRQEAAPQPVPVDYGGAAKRRPASTQTIGVDDEQLRQLLMSLRGY